MKKLVAPQGLRIDFTPSEKQLILWNALQPNRCDKCGGTLEIRKVGVDSKGMAKYDAVCTKCGNNDIPEMILGGGSAGGGKMISLNSTVCTPFGFRPLKDMKVGDIISNPTTGKQQRIIWIHPMGKFPFYRINFSDKTSVECSEGHLWRAHQSKKKSKLSKYNPEHFKEYGDDRIWTAKSIYEWYEKKKTGVNKDAHLIIPLTKPVEFTISGRSRIVDPYVLGALIGDGCIADSVIDKGYVEFTTMDQEIVDRFIAAGYDMSNWHQKQNSRAKGYYIRDKKLIEDLRKLGVIGKKSQNHFIPQRYMYATINERIQLMQGLMDTDGYVDSRGHMSYTTTSQQLAKDVAFVVRSLGGFATITSDIGQYRNEFGEKILCSQTWTVQFRTKMNPDLCGLTRKKERARYDFNGGYSEPGKSIDSVEYIGEQESFCISVSDPSGLYIVDDFTVTHNSYIGSAWLISSCMRFDNMLFVVARKTIKVLLTSTWLTIQKILREWGLKEDENYHINNQYNYIDFWNGSRIMALGLEPVLSDPEWTWLGSIEISGAFIDEASEVLEKGVEVLASRIRHRINETFIVGKLYMSCNPHRGWLRRTFVLDDDDLPVVLPKGYRYIPFGLNDNPVESFVAVYSKRLDNIKDKATRNRLKYGDWRITADNKEAAYWNFDQEIHEVSKLREVCYDPLKPLILSFDFNVLPYMTCEVSQVDYEKKEYYNLFEFIGLPEAKTNNTPAFCRMVVKKLKALSHLSGLIITGDPAGRARSTQTEDGVNNFTIAQKALLEGIGGNVMCRLFDKQPSQITRLDFENSVFGGYDDWKVMVDSRCTRLITDFIYQQKNADGTKQKKKVILPTGGRGEQYGHASDCFDYAICYFLGDSFSRYQKADIPIVTTVSDDMEVYNQFDY